MPLLCVKCDSRVEALLTKRGFWWCPACEEEITRDNVYKVGKRFFAGGVGAMLAAVAALTQTGTRSMSPLRAGTARSTLMEMKRQQRKKLKGLKAKQRRHTKQKGGRK